MILAPPRVLLGHLAHDLVNSAFEVHLAGVNVRHCFSSLVWKACIIGVTILRTDVLVNPTW